jgi:hypothetical protein
MDRRIGNKQIFMRFITIVLGCTFLCADGFRDPSFEFNYPSSDIHVGADSVGAFNGTIHNISSGTITIAVVRRVNDLPNNWTSSICLGATCYNESIDSVSIQIAAGDSSACGILAWISGRGAGTVQLDLFDLDSDDHLVVDVNFYAGMMALDEGDFQPYSISLFPVFPNPFNPVTTIRFDISVETLQSASLQILDLQGRLVVSLVKGDFITGEHEIQWNASNHSSGIYFAELVSGNYRQVQKLVLMK